MTPHDKFKFDTKNQFNREKTETAFNTKLTKIDTITSAAEVPGSGVTERIEKYLDKEIPIYDLQGFPFVALTTGLGYKTEGNTNYETSIKAVEDPAFFARKLRDIPSEEWTPNEKVNSISNTISLSYSNTDTIGYRGIGNQVNGNAPFYGFDHIRPSTYLKANQGDARTGSHVDDKRFSTVITTPEDLEKPQEWYTPYNEVAVLRYDEDGNPPRPDYIFTLDNHIPEASLKHAAYYNIPIVNLQTSAYQNHQKGGQPTA